MKLFIQIFIGAFIFFSLVWFVNKPTVEVAAPIKCDDIILTKGGGKICEVWLRPSTDLTKLKDNQITQENRI
jgi:hypothetical protein